MNAPPFNDDAELFAWVSRMPNGRLVIVGLFNGVNHLPMVTMNREVITGEVGRMCAMSHHEATGQPVYLMRFAHAEVLETLSRD